MFAKSLFSLENNKQVWCAPFRGVHPHTSEVKLIGKQISDFRLLRSGRISRVVLNFMRLKGIQLHISELKNQRFELTVRWSRYDGGIGFNQMRRLERSLVRPTKD